MVAVWVWVVFAAGVVAVLLIDLLVFHRRALEVRVREAAVWTAVWLGLAVAFAGVVWGWRGGEAATEYLTGYLIERSLSIDNVFVVAVIFTYFAVPPAYRHRALLWGVVGALVLRAVFIAVGAAALEAFSWTIYVLGGFLVATGVRLAVREVEAHPDRNLVVRVLRRVIPMTHHFQGQRFFVRLDRRLMATPMLAVLVAVASTDVAFAVDSVPAIFAVTDDAFLVFAANAFSVLGMLALYFLLAGMLDRFRYLRPGLAAILVFVGIKMSIAHVYAVPTTVSLALIVSILGAAVAASLLRERREHDGKPAAVPPARQSRLRSYPNQPGGDPMFDGFHSAIVGIDGSDESFAALDQARHLLAGWGALTAVAVCEERLAVHAGFQAPRFAAEIHKSAASALEQAATELAALPKTGTRLLHGRPTQRLLTAAEEARADLLVVGTHEHSRAAGMMIGSVASEILHHAHETVLVARRRWRPEVASIIVGVDGSPASLGALAVARELATREGARLRAVAAEGGKSVDSALLDEVPGVERLHGRHPVDVLVAAAEDADLVVLGSRGLHGLAALGSISERVAHHAPCSVLVVRGTALTRALMREPASEEAIPA